MLEYSFSKLATQWLIDRVDVVRYGRSNIIRDFGFTLKSVQFISRVFLLAIVGAFSDVTEELEVNFSFADAEFWILNIISMD